jgi:hypothetical protein
VHQFLLIDTLIAKVSSAAFRLGFAQLRVRLRFAAKRPDARNRPIYEPICLYHISTAAEAENKGNQKNAQKSPTDQS